MNSLIFRGKDSAPKLRKKLSDIKSTISRQRKIFHHAPGVFGKSDFSLQEKDCFII